MRKTKLVITVGPALADRALLREALLLADVVRINASHSRMEDRSRILREIRGISDELGRDIPVFLDLQGPKWRIGLMEANQQLEPGSTGAFFPAGTQAPVGLAWCAPIPHQELFAGAKPGQTWSLDDGAIVVEVTSARADLIEARVKVGGTLKPRKGIHPIGLDVAIDPLTPQDLDDVAWGVAESVDFFAQSFVRSAQDVEALETKIRAQGGNQPVIAKIEHPMALQNLEAILEVAWGVMVARGDLGVELGVEKVPTLQKDIIRMARQALKPVITATQMLESMIENPQPTRAEASDVANAIWDGTDAVMLSAESAAGRHPIEAIRWLARIAEDADAHLRPRMGRSSDRVASSLSSRTDVSVAFAACRTAEDIGAKYILVFTVGGVSARMVSRLAANTPVIGATSEIENVRRMGLLRGVEGLLIPRAHHMSEMEATVYPMLKARMGLQAGDRIVVTLGHPLWTTGNTNTVKVVTLE